MSPERKFHLRRVIVPYRQDPTFNLSPDWGDKGVECPLGVQGSQAPFLKAPVADTSKAVTPVTQPVTGAVGAGAAISGIAEIMPGSFRAAKLLRKGGTEELHRSPASMQGS